MRPGKTPSFLSKTPIPRPVGSQQNPRPAGCDHPPRRKQPAQASDPEEHPTNVQDAQKLIRFVPHTGMMHTIKEPTSKPRDWNRPAQVQVVKIRRNRQATSANGSTFVYIIIGLVSFSRFANEIEAEHALDLDNFPHVSAHSMLLAALHHSHR
ncbi:hypothetical protein TruAng_008633 [Truncatella angustata]|nr:hypothetical protein TruAng_008633 [Truncatella angustata]